MTQQFKKGQKVRATAEAANLVWDPVREIREGDVGVYVERGMYHVVDFPQRKRVYLADDEIEPYVETPSFKKGDKVTVREGATSIGGHKTDNPKEVRTVRRVWGDGRAGLTPARDGGAGNVFEPEDLVPYVETPAPLDPSGRHDLAADFFHAKTGTAASYFTVDLSLDERAPYYAAADAFLATQPAPEPEPEYENGAVIRTAFSEYHMIAGEFVDIHDGGPLAGNPDIRPLVVLDPAEVESRLNHYLAGTGESRTEYADLLGNVFPELGLTR